MISTRLPAADPSRTPAAHPSDGSAGRPVARHRAQSPVGNVGGKNDRALARPTVCSGRCGPARGDQGPTVGVGASPLRATDRSPLTRRGPELGDRNLTQRHASFLTCARLLRYSAWKVVPEEEVEEVNCCRGDGRRDGRAGWASRGAGEPAAQPAAQLRARSDQGGGERPQEGQGRSVREAHCQGPGVRARPAASQWRRRLVKRRLERCSGERALFGAPVVVLAVMHVGRSSREAVALSTRFPVELAGEEAR